MKLQYDLHIHTALSPCCAEDMTPNNIVNMALINELDIIAITDHNTCENVEVVMKVAEGTGLIVVPGMEVETREEIHVVCLFMDIDSVYNVQNTVYERLPQMPNNRKIFGEQMLFDEDDEVIGRNDRLLSFASDISIDELVQIVRDCGGVVIPAHIDRPSYSIISNLGIIPDYLNLTTLEVSRHNAIDEYVKKYTNSHILQNSDAHDLGYIGVCGKTIELEDKSIKALLDYIKS